jgi:tetratricopeptide (TPR) repeat protein
VDYGAPIDSAVSSQAGSGMVGGQRSTGSNVMPTEPSVKPLAEAAKQSTQIAALQERLREFYESRYGVDPNAVKPVKPVQPSEEPKKPEDEPNTKPPGGGMDRPPGDDLNPPKAPGNDAPLPPRPGEAGANKPKEKPKPIRITSFAAGVQARGLADLMQNAEALMKEGKYSSAIRQYEAAEQVAPNNGLILIGRATAELGASFYRRADTSLREAFLLDQSMMLAQYDLRQMIGDDRLQFVVRELKDLANKEPQNPSPLFLLAFIAYNTGNEVNAAGFLDQADKRAAGNDAVIKMVREHWALPALDQNK